ncbi:hypothetical protein [uncultured Thiodictyon sp.]|uniref:hypothetical protein n=1 Tax=uncultured Thiodictyon sp. TaxID=1846217 RepID=UPI0025CE5725|nr:hypothetical protein [uncultured Thiodictyon sp.]
MREAEFFLERLKEAGTADYNDTLFLMTAYFDAFVFCYVSIEEMLSDPKKEALRELSIFRFFKALRNISTHHSILTGIRDSKFERPISRVVSVGVGCHVAETAKFFLLPDKVHVIFDALLLERPKEKYTIDPARTFLDEISRSNDTIYLTNLMQRALSEATVYVT